VQQTQCPFCGGRLGPEGVEEASVTDIPAQPEPVISLFHVHVCRCRRCGRAVRGTHPAVAPNQYGATAPTGAARESGGAFPALRPWCAGAKIASDPAGDDRNRSDPERLDAGRDETSRGAGRRRLPGIAGASTAGAGGLYTDDTSWRIGGDGAYLMAFDTCDTTVYQVRTRHGNEQVRELVPGDYRGTLVTDRGTSYEAEELSAVEQHKCLSHLIRNVTEVVEKKTGRAKAFGLPLKGLLQQANQLWRKQREAKIPDYHAHVERIDQELTQHLRIRRLRDRDNQRLLDGIGLQHDQGRVLNFLYQSEVEPTNNRAERALRPAVIARKVSQCSKTQRGADAFAAFTSVVRTAIKRGAATVTQTLHTLRRPAPPPDST